MGVEGTTSWRGRARERYTWREREREREGRKEGGKANDISGKEWGCVGDKGIHMNVHVSFQQNHTVPRGTHMMQHHCVIPNKIFIF